MKKETGAVLTAIVLAALLTGCNHTDHCEDDALISSVITGKGGGKTKSRLRTGTSHHTTVHHYHHDCD